MLKPFAPDIWIADGSEIVATLGFRYPTRMSVVRLADGGLFVWSPVALSEGLRAEVDMLGEVRHLVAPNSLHYLFIPEWKRAFPTARVHAASGLREKRADIAVDTELGDAPNAAWAGEIDQVTMAGNRITTEIVFFHRRSGTVLFTDLLQQMPEGFYSGWRAFVARWDLMVSPEPSVPRKFRIAFTDRRAARAALDRVLAWPIERVVMAHGTPVAEGGRECIAEAFGWLTSPTRL